MKKIFFLTIFLSLGIWSCSPQEDNQPVITISQTENPEWALGVYYSEQDPEKMAVFEPGTCFFDLSFTNNGSLDVYKAAYYLPFISHDGWNSIENLSVTETNIEFDYYDIHSQTDIHFAVTKINDETINILITAAGSNYDFGNFTK